MGFRFKKSISLVPGIKLNLGKTGMSISAGMPGFRKTFHTSGRVTTSIGIPGTGLYYVDTQNPKKQSDQDFCQSNVGRAKGIESELRKNILDKNSSCERSETCPEREKNVSSSSAQFEHQAVSVSLEMVQLNAEALRSIHKTSDDSIDWTEVLVSPLPPDDTYNQDMWAYYHSMADKVLSGDIDSYLQLIYDVNPLEDLLLYGGRFQFGTDDPCKIEVEFTVNTDALDLAKNKMDPVEYNNLLKDYVCSVCIRIARDMFALLPVVHTMVHALMDGQTIVSVNFDRERLSKIKFGYIDPSDVFSLFQHNMRFDNRFGFCPVTNLK